MSELESRNKLPGLIYTFYSYKGGVGRSMALANVGVLMAAEGHRVLLVDWDLEAPGLEVFFSNAAKLVGDPSKTPGIVDLLQARAQGKKLAWHDCILKAEFFGRSLDIVSAGRRTDDYLRRVQKLDWVSLFREHRIGNYINELREEWRDTYDFVLIDSRTGINDIGDICTVILPDVLVLLFVTNYQNIEGIKNVMHRAVVARSKLPVNRSELHGVPVPARAERNDEYDDSEEWQNRFASEFGELYREWLPKEVKPSDALNHIFIPYIAKWSFGERIPVLESERERADATSLGAAYARLATLLSHRLDWTAIEAKASTADAVGARMELSMARDAKRKAESQLEDARHASVRLKKHARVWAGASFLIVLLAIAGGFWWNSTASIPSTLDILVAQLADPVSSVRADAARLIGGIAVSDENAHQFAPEVATLLKDGDPKVRKEAVRALGFMGENGAEFVAEVALLLKDIDPVARSSAAGFLHMMALSLNEHDVEQFAPEIALLLKDGDPRVRSNAASALGSMAISSNEQDVTQFAPELARLLKDSDPKVRGQAAMSLGIMGENGAMFATAVAELLQDKQKWARRGAVVGLGRMGEAGKPFAPQIAELANDESEDSLVRGASVNALKKLGKQELIENDRKQD